MYSAPKTRPVKIRDFASLMLYYTVPRHTEISKYAF
jgi:hypothetical protein